MVQSQRVWNQGHAAQYCRIGMNLPLTRIERTAVAAAVTRSVRQMRFVPGRLIGCAKGSDQQDLTPIADTYSAASAW